MNIFGRSQEQQSIDTKTIAVTATPTLTRVIKNAYTATLLKTFVSGTFLSNVDISGIGSKTISSLSTGETITVSLSGAMELDNGIGNGLFQFQFLFTDGTNTHDQLFTEVNAYPNSFLTGAFNCIWKIQKSASSEIKMGWYMTVPDPTNPSLSKIARIVNYEWNLYTGAYVNDAPITVDIKYKQSNDDRPAVFRPTFYQIDVTKDIALTAAYI